MICSHCSNQIQDDTRFCPFCGAEQTVATNEVPNDTTTAYQDACAAREQEAEKAKKANSIMILGIISLAIAYAVNSIAGLILANITRSKIAQYQLDYSIIDGRAKLGQTLSTVARILSILGIVAAAIMVVVYLFIFVMYGIALTEIFSISNF